MGAVVIPKNTQFNTVTLKFRFKFKLTITIEACKCHEKKKILIWFSKIIKAKKFKNL